MVKKRFDAEIPVLPEVIDYINGFLDKAGWGQDEKATMDIAVEEIFVNIAFYAYEKLPGAERFADISVDTDGGDVTIIFEDGGIEYNPLLKEDPDVTLPAEDRRIGGLGVYMVKMSMDRVSYDRVDGKNVFTIFKKKD